MLHYGIYSRKDKDILLLKVLKYLTKERLILKEKGKSGDIESKLRQGALKILINSIYGFYGSDYSYNDYAPAELVTAYGRLIIKHMEKTVIDNGGKIIEIDTDGIIFQSGAPSDIFQKVQDSLPSGFKIELEFQDCSVFINAIKNYIVFNGNNEVKELKGVYRKRNIARYEKEFPIEYLKNYLSGDGEVYFRKINTAIVNNDLPIDYFSISRRVKKNEKQFDHLNYAPGEKIIYYQGYSDEVNKKTGERKYTPVISGEYHKEYYLKEIQRIEKEIDTKIGAPGGNNNV